MSRILPSTSALSINSHRPRRAFHAIVALLALNTIVTGRPLFAAGPEKIESMQTFGSIGKDETTLTHGKEVELLRHSGAGCLTHMWFGGDFANSAKTRIRIYVDGEKSPSIDMELFLGAGIGFGDAAAPWGTGKMGRTGDGDNVYNTFPIPFGNGVRVTAQLADGAPEHPALWWIIRGTENLQARLGSLMLPRRARLHLYRVEGHLAKPLEEMTLADVKSAGALYLVTVAAKGTRPNRDWKDLSFMEGTVRAYMNGETKPVFLSSGFEDYFLGTYYFNRGKYANDLAGVTHFDPANAEVSAYRFHDTDPVIFQRGLRLTLRRPVEGDPPPTIYTTYVWVYEW
jgi:hypothetical protein